MSKPSIPKGTRDFTPQEMVRRNYIFDTIRKVFQKYGYLPIETPAMEKTETLMGKYGEEGDRLIFKILPRGAKLNKFYSNALKNIEFESKGEKYTLIGIPPDKINEKIIDETSLIGEEALRYDLTVPFARFVVQHQNEISFPFKRYQIQPVWRADRPQKGRYREFYQCDADVVGSDSLLYEVELIQMVHEVYQNLDLKVEIKINNRKVLQGLAELFEAEDKFTDLFVALDKKDKIQDGIYDELREKGFDEKSVVSIKQFIEEIESIPSSKGKSRFLKIKEIFTRNEISIEGIEEVEFIFNTLETLYPKGTVGPNLSFNIALARGLSYYTGAIFEVEAIEGGFKSSINGGGRYDDLTGIFGMKGVSGVGISFGADRIYDVLMELDKFPEEAMQATTVLFTNFGGEEEIHALGLLKQVRDAGISAEIYPENAKMKKQFKYADDKQVKFVAVIGSEEREKGEVSLKNMKSGEQKNIKQEELITILSK